MVLFSQLLHSFTTSLPANHSRLPASKFKHHLSESLYLSPCIGYVELQFLSWSLGDSGFLSDWLHMRSTLQLSGLAIGCILFVNGMKLGVYGGLLCAAIPPSTSSEG